MFTVIAVLVVLLAVATSWFGYRTYKDNQAASKAAAGQIAGGVSAFGKLAEAETKLLALKAAAEAKALEAKAVHATLDEIHKLLG